MNPLDMGVQVPSLGEGGWAEHAEVRLLASVSCHVGLQHHLLVEGLAAVCALEGPLSCRRDGGKVRERDREARSKQVGLHIGNLNVHFRIQATN